MVSQQKRSPGPFVIQALERLPGHQCPQKGFGCEYEGSLCRLWWGTIHLKVTSGWGLSQGSQEPRGSGS